ncbi:MAG: GTPase Era [bacterium]
MFKAGFVTITGQPNVGKSTLLNKLVGQKVSIISYKPQTTRNRIMGIVNVPNAQLVLIDTPGIHKPTTRLNKRMVDTAFNALKGIDLILFMVDVKKTNGEDQVILKKMKAFKTEMFLLINKVDLINKKELLPIINEYKNFHFFSEIIPISATTGENLDVLLEELVKRLPEGVKYFPDDIVTDRPESFIVSEMIREQIINLTREELPYAVHVVIEEMKEDKEKNIINIEAIIYVERSSQKGIIIGKGGQMIKQIGSRAREEIEAILDTKVYLDLRVNLKKDWRKRDNVLGNLGYKHD